MACLGSARHGVETFGTTGSDKGFLEAPSGPAGDGRGADCMVSRGTARGCVVWLAWATQERLGLVVRGRADLVLLDSA
jgi:hypothetical protein